MKKLLITLIVTINCLAQESSAQESSAQESSVQEISRLSSKEDSKTYKALRFTPTYEESEMKILDFANVRYTAALEKACEYQKRTSSNIAKIESARNTLGVVAITRLLSHHLLEGNSSNNLPIITFWGAGSVCLGLTGFQYFYKKHAQEKIKKDLDPSKIDFQDFIEKIRQDYSEDCQLVKNINEMERLRSW